MAAKGARNNGALASLALKHGNPPRRKPRCAKCGEADTEARVVVLVNEIANGGSRGKQVVSKTRSMCGACTADVFESIMGVLPTDGAL